MVGTWAVGAVGFKMNICSLFEEKEFSDLLTSVIKNEKPKKVLEKTKWYDFLVLQSFVDKNIKDFINFVWPFTESKFLLYELLNISNKNITEIKIRDELKNLIIDKKLIETIETERKEILLKRELGLALHGPKPKSKKIKVCNKTINCVAVIERYQNSVAYENIYNFLIDLSTSWIKELENGSPHMDCSNQLTDDKNEEIAEIIFLNFPKTFDICEKTYHLYICEYNWNFTKKNCIKS